jgi:(2R)-3-sulfolactate dehydrogenase (NADP+)
MKLRALDAIDYAANLLIASGMNRTDSDISSRSIVVSDLWDNGGHGLMRLPFYLARISEGGINPRAKLRSISRAPSVATFDGEFGLGHWQVWNVALLGAEMAIANGISFVSIRNSNHCGALGVYVYPALDRQLLSIVVSTGPAVMPAIGGRAPILSTSPIAAGIPASPTPIVIDMATSAVARGKIAAAAAKQESIPQGWAFDQEGIPTMDAQAALRGMLAPLGGAKGFALALLVESLSAGLSGGTTADQIPDMFRVEDDSKPQGISHSIITIDPSKVAGEESLKRFSKIARNVTDSGGRIPGGGRLNPTEIGEQEITILDGVYADLNKWAERLGVEPRG